MGYGYFTNVRITDFGPYVTKIILPMPVKPAEEPEKDSFCVYVERRDQQGKIVAQDPDHEGRTKIRTEQCGDADGRARGRVPG